MRFDRLVLALPVLLTACASAPSAPPRQVPCPVPPVLDAPPASALEVRFLERMQNFLQGKLPEPTSSAPASPSASNNTKP